MSKQEDEKTPAESLIEDVILNVDIFMQAYCGYWARGMAFDPSLGMLVVDTVHHEQQPRAFFHGDTEEAKEAERAWRAGLPLPAGWYRFDRPFAEKALQEGLKKYGEDFPETGDGPQIDVAVQRALFGEVRYG